jgi:hypothetical protein
MDSWKQTYEGIVSYEDGRKFSYYCYIAVVPVDPNRPVKVGEALMNRVRTDFGVDKTFGWKDVTCKRPDGTGIEWQTGTQPLNVAAEEFFAVEANKTEGFQAQKAQFLFYLHKEATAEVLVVWKVPDFLVGHLNVGRMAELVAGSLAVGGAAAQPAPQGQAQPEQAKPAGGGP